MYIDTKILINVILPLQREQNQLLEHTHGSKIEIDFC